MTSAEAHVKKFRKELHSGIAAMVLLALLERTGDEMYGYQIAKEIGAKAGGASFLKQGAIYPVLRSLHAAGHGALGSLRGWPWVSASSRYACTADSGLSPGP